MSIEIRPLVRYCCLGNRWCVLLENVTHEPVYSSLNFIQRMGAEFTTVQRAICKSSQSRGTKEPI